MFVFLLLFEQDGSSLGHPEWASLPDLSAWVSLRMFPAWVSMWDILVWASVSDFRVGGCVCPTRVSENAHLDINVATLSV